jgi:enhancing lycopene biosynthesis protein 2
MRKIGVVLSGCGVMDGSEIHEAVSVLLALSQAGVRYQCMAPNAPQMNVMDHVKKQPVLPETRNVLAESARIARGDIAPLNEVAVGDYAGFIFPGGFGAAKNLCTFAIEGPTCSVQPDVARVIREAHAAGIPQCFICIAPVLCAKVLGLHASPQLTIGSDPETAAAIAAMGAQHVECDADSVVVDEQQRIVTTPAYMTAESVAEVFTGVSRAVSQLLRLAGYA